MPVFNCGACDKRIKVPDSYAGKRVRCPGCSSAQRVPDVVNAAALDAFASLDAEGDVAARTVREILIGCGPCGKSIRLEEHQLGRTAPCPACGTLLAVDAFDLPKPGKRGGGLVDMSHLELDAADPLLGGRGFPADPGGSTLGASSLHGSGSHAAASGYALTGVDDATSLGGGAGDSQTQMRELRELNDLKHSGGISDAQYKQRKKEIYSGRTMAIQAMSRSSQGVSGASGRAAMGRAKPLLPGPVKTLLTVLGVGVGAYLLWDNVLASDSGSAVPVAGAPAVPAGVVALSAPAPAPALEAVLEAPEVVDPVEAPLALAPDPVQEVPESPVELVVEEVVEEAAPEPEPEGDWVVTEWPIRTGTQTSPDARLPLGKACSYVMRLQTRNGKATAGVAIGPLVESMDDPAYQAFCDDQFEIILSSAKARGMLHELEIKQTDKPVRVGRRVVDRLTIEHKTKRTAQAVVLALVQDGRAMAYWFEGQKLAYRSFISAVGTAQIMSERQIRLLQEEEAARRELF